MFHVDLIMIVVVDLLSIVRNRIDTIVRVPQFKTMCFG